MYTHCKIVKELNVIMPKLVVPKERKETNLWESQGLMIAHYVKVYSLGKVDAVSTTREKI